MTFQFIKCPLSQFPCQILDNALTLTQRQQVRSPVVYFTSLYVTHIMLHQLTA